MFTETQAFDAYEAVLADLRAQREKIDSAIQAIEALRGGTSMGASSGNGSANAGGNGASGVDGPGAFLGLTITDAAKKLLAARRQPLKNPDIVAAFKIGGLHLNSKDPVNTVGAVLTRRSVENGDIVKVGRGIWGLKEWYPNRSFKKKAIDAADDDLSDLMGEAGAGTSKE